ncbi:MAG: DDE-type integrase/transposase/recombinase [Brumimicrobium sp.]
MYQRYTTSLKTCFALGLEKSLVSKEVLQKIPSSTSSAWRNYSNHKLIGVEQEKQIKKDFQNISNAHHPINHVPKKMFDAFCAFTVCLVESIDKKQIQKAYRKNKEYIIEVLDKYSNYISYQNAAKIIKVSEKTLYHWRHQVKYACQNSALLLCTKRHPNQATLAEVNTIKSYLKEQKFAHWGIHSIWAKAFSLGDTKLSEPTWYEYNRLLKIRTTIKKGKKSKYKPIIASKINEIWHADITVFKTLDGVKHYIYTVMDNFSRFIHSWRIETVVSAQIRLDTIEEALKNDYGEEPPDQTIQLITDGGPENDNLTLKEFMHKNQTSIKHDIALKDIVQSNSMMEAFYSIAKYRYLYQQPIHNTKELIIQFENLIQEYHFEKPHYALGIYTPSQVLNGSNSKQAHKSIYIEAAKERREINKKKGCGMDC